jgi:hypothetical protein
MKSNPPSSASLAMVAQLSQSASQRSGSLLTARPDEQFAPNRPSLKAFLLYIS